MSPISSRFVALVAAVVGTLTPLLAVGDVDPFAPEIKIDIEYGSHSIKFTDGPGSEPNEVTPQITLHDLRQRVSREPTAKNYADRGMFQALGGNAELGLSDITVAISIEPSWRLYLLRSTILLAQNEIGKSRVDLESAILTVPKEDAAAAIAIAGMLTEPDKGSIERLTSAIELEPENGDYLLMRSHRYLILNRPEQAIADIRAAIKLGYDSVFARYYLCSAYRHAREWKLANQEYEKAYKDFPKSFAIAHAWARYLMQVRLRSKEQQSLINCAIRCCELTEWEHADSLILLGDAYKKAGDDEAAIEAYTEAKEFAVDAQLEEIANALK